MKATLLDSYRRMWCWQDEWYGLDLVAVRSLEEETTKYLRQLMGPLTEQQAKSEVEPESEPTQLLRLNDIQQEDNELFSSTESELVWDCKPRQQEQQEQQQQEEVREEVFEDAIET